MNKKELSEIRRRLKPSESAIYRIYGCYVNGNREIISEFNTSLGLMTEEETEMYLKLIKKSISGTLGKHLIELEFDTDQVMSSEEHKLLMKLKNSGLEDEEARKELCSKIIESTDFDDKNYLILMASDTMDIVEKGRDGSSIDDFGGGDTHRYFICSVCPVKDASLELKYNSDNGRFNSFSTGHTAVNPEMGFMFPAFDDRRTNIYGAVYYTRKPAIINGKFIEEIFGTKVPMSAVKQKHTFGYALSESLDDECSMEVVSSLHEEICNRIEENKLMNDDEPLAVSADEISMVLRENGLEEEKIDTFCEEWSRYFGDDSRLNPNNLVDVKKFIVETPEVKISVDAENRHLIDTRIIDGRKYILVAADQGVTVNGIEVNISEEKEHH